LGLLSCASLKNQGAEFAVKERRPSIRNRSADLGDVKNLFGCKKCGGRVINVDLWVMRGN
jgi:hypothetical protein